MQAQSYRAFINPIFYFFKDASVCSAIALNLLTLSISDPFRAAFCASIRFIFNRAENYDNDIDIINHFALLLANYISCKLSTHTSKRVFGSNAIIRNRKILVPKCEKKHVEID